MQKACRKTARSERHISNGVLERIRPVQTPAESFRLTCVSLFCGFFAVRTDLSPASEHISAAVRTAIKKQQTCRPRQYSPFPQPDHPCISHKESGLSQKKASAGCQKTENPAFFWIHTLSPAIPDTAVSFQNLLYVRHELPEQGCISRSEAEQLRAGIRRKANRPCCQTGLYTKPKIRMHSTFLLSYDREHPALHVHKTRG